MTQTTDSFGVTGRIERNTYAMETVHEQCPGWDSLSDAEKLDALRSCEPADSETVYNVTTERFHEYLVDNLDPDQAAGKDDLSVQWFALGTGGASGTSVSDTDLNVRTYEETVTDVADNGTELLASTFLDSTEGNGNVFDELGLFTGDPANLADPDVFLINHATFADVTKDNTKTVTFDVRLTFGDA